MDNNNVNNGNNDVEHFDLLVIGGGINGAGIARDAAGRGYSVCLCEASDFASGTSSASTKLFHGGLRYLEYFEFKLVREALSEREILLRAMPHISWPQRFVLPYHRDMRFEGQTPVSKLMHWVMPWMKGRRPAWLIRFGLFLYDSIGGRELLPGTKSIDLKTDAVGLPLKAKFEKAFEYSDCWVDDARLVVLNLVDAQARGAQINPRTAVTSVDASNDNWRATLTCGQTIRQVTARAIINAAGPWVDEVLRDVFGNSEADNVRLVRGSHIVVNRKFDHDRCYFLQNSDGRIIFAIPYEQDYTLIGTTDVDHEGDLRNVSISEEEQIYLCEMASQYFEQPVTPDNIVWTYSGIRPLFDDGASQARAATREYVLKTEQIGQATLINVFGGKITTYRRLAEEVMSKIETVFNRRDKTWTAEIPLPGGSFAVDGVEFLISQLMKTYPFLPAATIKRLARTYGTLVPSVLGNSNETTELGIHFGADLYQCEVDYLVANEWVQSAEDLLFRRTKLGLRLTGVERSALQEYIEQQLTAK